MEESHYAEICNSPFPSGYNMIINNVFLCLWKCSWENATMDFYFTGEFLSHALLLLIVNKCALKLNDTRLSKRNFMPTLGDDWKIMRIHSPQPFLYKTAIQQLVEEKATSLAKWKLIFFHLSCYLVQIKILQSKLVVSCRYLSNVAWTSLFWKQP
jgi:hypothetical protein